MFPIFRGWPLRGLAIVTYETATRSVAVDQQWTLYTTAPRLHATLCILLLLYAIIIIDTIKVYLTDIGCEGMECIKLAHGTA
jgi:hypothetical protein